MNMFFKEASQQRIAQRIATTASQQRIANVVDDRHRNDASHKVASVSLASSASDVGGADGRSGVR